jgi:hypothetical protein
MSDNEPKTQSRPANGRTVIAVLAIAVLGLSACTSSGNPQASNSGNSTTTTDIGPSPDTGNAYNDGYTYGIDLCVAAENFNNQSPTRSCAGVDLRPALSAAEQCGVGDEQLLYTFGIGSDDNVQEWQIGCEAATANGVF